MEVRPAVEADAAALSTLGDLSVSTARNVVHDRTVRVAVPDSSVDRSTPADGVPAVDRRDGDSVDDSRDLLGYVCFDATTDAVIVTGLYGTVDACERLLDEPVRFARCENLPVELVVETGREQIESAARAAGFGVVGDGPRFDDRPTRRYRYRP